MAVFLARNLVARPRFLPASYIHGDAYSLDLDWLGHANGRSGVSPEIRAHCQEQRFTRTTSHRCDLVIVNLAAFFARSASQRRGEVIPMWIWQKIVGESPTFATSVGGNA